MKALMTFIGCVMAILLIGYIASGQTTPSVITGLLKAKITPAASDLAPELTARRGTWEASNEEVLPNRLTIEEIHSNWATVVYSWADHPTAGLKAGWARVRAKVLPDGTLHWGYPGRFTLKMARDGMSLEGKKEQAGRVSNFTMRKVEPLVAK